MLMTLPYFYHLFCRFLFLLLLLFYTIIVVVIAALIFLANGIWSVAFPSLFCVPCFYLKVFLFHVVPYSLRFFFMWNLFLQHQFFHTSSSVCVCFFRRLLIRFSFEFFLMAQFCCFFFNCFYFCVCLCVPFVIRFISELLKM